jgi:hypothetical protein
MPWSIVDACDYVRPSATQMNFKYTTTEQTVPLAKAYNVYENPGLTYQERMANYEGPTEVKTEFKSNDFKHYTNSGGISKKEDLSNTISSIQDRIARAQKIKGTLCLNNANTYGNSWKTPQIDMKLKQLHGGATAQRFYSKFPIYRERAGHEKVDVHEDIGDVWKRTIDLNPVPVQHPLQVSSDNMRTNSFFKNTFHTRNESLSNTVANVNNKFGDLKDAKNRSKSNISQTSISRREPTYKSLKLIGGQTITMPTRERFNEEVESVIQESKDKKLTQTINQNRINLLKDRESTVSHRSKKTLTANDLKSYFKQSEEDIKSKFS